LLAALLALLALLACGDGDRFIGVGDGRDAATTDGSTADASRDGSASGDGSNGDGDGDRDGGGDGDGDGSDGGGGTGDGDGDGSDGGGIDDLPPQCEISDDDAREISVAIVESGFSIAPGATGFGLTYAREACQQALDVVRVESNGPFTDGTTLVDDCRTVLDVGLAKSGAGFQLAYTDNSTDSVELHAIELDAELVPVGEPATRRLTDNALIERRPAVADIGGTPLVAYITEESYERSITTQRMSEVDGKPAEPNDLFERSAGRIPIELDISPIGAGAGLVWVEESGKQGIWYQSLSDVGAALGTPQQLSSFAAPSSTIDITRRANDGGAIVFAVGIDAASQELRFQRLAEDGALRGDVIKLVSQPLQAKDAGIASVAGGYAIAYRALPDGETISEPQIRIAFITKYGRAVRDRAGRIVSHLIAPAQHDGSRVHIEVSVDGQILLAFVDGNATGSSTLRLIRRTLGC
jgi:hypothetical protein